MRGGPFSGLFKGSPRAAAASRCERVGVRGVGRQRPRTIAVCRWPGRLGWRNRHRSADRQAGDCERVSGGVELRPEPQRRSRVAVVVGGRFLPVFREQLEQQAADVPKLRPRREPADEAHQQGVTVVFGQRRVCPVLPVPSVFEEYQTTDSPVGSDYGYAFDSQWVRSACAGASIDDKFTKKSSISASANWTQQVLTADNRTIETEGVGMRYNHSFTRKLSFTSDTSCRSPSIRNRVARRSATAMSIWASDTAMASC